MRKILFILMFGILFAQSDLGVTDGQLKMQNKMIDAFDDTTRALTIIDYAHHEVHEGNQFMYTYFDSDFDNGDTIFFSFVTPDTTVQFHFVGSAGNSSACTVYFLEAPTITAGKGTDVVILNRNRASTATSLILSSKDSTVTKITYDIVGHLTNLGTTLEAYTLGSGKNKIAGATRDFNEWVLNEYTRYAFMVIGTANDGILDLRIGYYQHIPGGD